MSLEIQMSGLAQLGEQIRAYGGQVEADASAKIRGAAEGTQQDAAAGYAEHPEISRGFRLVEESPLAFKVSNSHPLAHLLERGTSVRTTSKGANRGRVNGRFHLVRAAVSRRARLEREYEDLLAAAARKVGLG